MKAILGFTFVIGAIIFCEAPAKAQDVCVIPDQRLEAIRGKVAVDNPEYFVEGADVRLTDKSRERKVIATAKSDAKGWFEINGIPKGKYFLVVSYPDTYPLYVPVKFSPGKGMRYLYAKLGGFIGRSCGGGDVEVRTKAKAKAG